MLAVQECTSFLLISNCATPRFPKAFDFIIWSTYYCACKDKNNQNKILFNCTLIQVFNFYKQKAPICSRTQRLRSST